MASDLTLFQRLMNVTEQQNSLSQHYTNTALAQDLWQQYREALNNYLLLCSAVPPSYPLYDPFLYFYRGKNDDIRTTVRYTYGQHRTSTRLTRNGFPYLLQAFFEPFQVISFPTAGPAVDHLYQKLTELILNYPYDRLSRLFNELKKYSPQMANKLNKADSLLYSSDGNLLINEPTHASENLTRFHPSILALCEFTFRQNSSGQYIPSKLLKNYLSELTRTFRENSGNVEQIKVSTPVKMELSDDLPTIYFQSGAKYAIQYDSDTDYFRFCTLPSYDAILGYQPKVVPIRHSADAACSSTLYSFFNSLCGTDPNLLDQFALLLAEAMMTDGKKMFVIHTKSHKHELQTFFSEVLRDTAVQIDSPTPFPSLNRLTKQPHLRSLFLAQIAGRCFVLVNDTPPSKESSSKLGKIIKGNRISINSDFAPPQNYYHRLGIICVTDDRSKADNLRKKRKATVLDFSHTETEFPDQLEFSYTDAAWIYQTLLPYGLKLKTLKDQKISDSAPFDVQRAPSPLTETACIHAFFQLCQKHNDCCCDTREVYQSYCQFLAVTQNGRKTEFSKIQFNKKFREISKSKFIYKRPHRSRKRPSPYCYIGLKLPETFPKSETAPSAPQEDCLMRYLKHIEKYQLTRQMKTTLDIPPSKK